MGSDIKPQSNDSCCFRGGCLHCGYAGRVLAQTRAETDGKIHYAGDVLTFKAQDTVFKMPGEEVSASSFRKDLDTDRADAHAEMGAVKVQVNDAIEASANDASNALTSHKEDFQASFTTQKNKVRSEQDASKGRLTSKEAVLIAKLEALETSLSNKIAAAKAKINAQLDTRVAKAARDIPNKFNAVQSTLAASAASFTKQQAAVLSAAKLKAGKNRPQWIGGRTSWGLWGWQKWTAGERRDFEGNMGHFSLQNGEWRILKQGMYRLQYWGVMLGSSGDGYAQIRVNGGNVLASARIPYKGGYWDGMHVDHIMKLKKGDTIALWLNSNWRTSHPTNQGRASAYNRAWFSFEGQWK